MQEKLRTIAGEDIEKGMWCYINDNILRKITTDTRFEIQGFFYFSLECPRDVKKGEFITVEIPR